MHFTPLRWLQFIGEIHLAYDYQFSGITKYPFDINYSILAENTTTTASIRTQFKVW